MEQMTLNKKQRVKFMNYSEKATKQVLNLVQKKKN